MTEAKTLNDVLAGVVTDWQAANNSMPTPEMIRFAHCVYFALLGAKVVMLPPNLDGAKAKLTFGSACPEERST
jgi:hypothetical protein